MHGRKIGAGGEKMWKSFALCIAISAGILMLLSIAGAAVLSCTDDPTAYVGISALAVTILSAAVSGAICRRIRRDEGMRLAVLSGLTVTLLMLLTGLTISGGVSPASLMNYLCYIGIFAIAAYLSGKGRRRRRRK